MTWHAVEAVDDALDATKALFLPVDARQWLALAFVAFFIAGAGSGPSATASGSSGGTTVTAPGQLGAGLQVPYSSETILTAALAILAIGLVLAALYAFVGSVMEFVFVESLRRRRVRIREYVGRHLGRGLRLFGFRVVLGMLAAVPFVGLVLAVLSAVGGEPRVSLGLLALSIPFVVALGAAAAAIDVFTTHFVVPVMIHRNDGVLAGWRRFWSTLTGEWKQYGVYAAVRIVLGIGAGIVASVVGSAVGAILLAPVALVAWFVRPALDLAVLASNPVALAVVVAVVSAFLLAMGAVMAIVVAPVQSFVRYHALFVLGDTDPALDLIPELRREIRDSDRL
ncbi:DUF7544 domain-containing protein [Halorussus marinus]|uniref:DUF7544 domain-containing protein n=1 Tax=Halorussus marinus TaxID=2505976 RepID=UPI001092C3D1|nr:hypothetical protein [Halorussus marinus]